MVCYTNKGCVKMLAQHKICPYNVLPSHFDTPLAFQRVLYRFIIRTVA